MSADILLKSKNVFRHLQTSFHVRKRLTLSESSKQFSNIKWKSFQIPIATDFWNQFCSDFLIKSKTRIWCLWMSENVFLCLQKSSKVGKCLSLSEHLSKCQQKSQMSKNDVVAVVQFKKSEFHREWPWWSHWLIGCQKIIWHVCVSGQLCVQNSKIGLATNRNCAWFDISNPTWNVQSASWWSSVRTANWDVPVQEQHFEPPWLFPKATPQLALLHPWERPHSQLSKTPGVAS